MPGGSDRSPPPYFSLHGFCGVEYLLHQSYATAFADTTPVPAIATAIAIASTTNLRFTTTIVVAISSLLSLVVRDARTLRLYPQVGRGPFSWTSLAYRGERVRRITLSGDREGDYAGDRGKIGEVAITPSGNQSESGILIAVRPGLCRIADMNFGERRQGEVRRIPLPRRWMHKVG